ncbi:MAG: response regulator, partial [Desulfobacterales bacterium]|nr:response regulator [Desulfobacterales bacterium]
TFTQQLWLLDLGTTETLAALAVKSPSIEGLRIFDHNRILLVKQGEFSKDEGVERVEKALIHQDGTPVGHIEVYFRVDSWQRNQAMILGTGFLMIAFIILISYFLISSILNRHLVKPLSILQGDMENIASGVYKASQIKGQKAEIQRIVDGFNQMTRALDTRERSKREAEAKLLKQTKLFETMFNTIPDGVFITNLTEEIILANRGAMSVFGYDTAEMLGKNIGELVAGSPVGEIKDCTPEQGNSNRGEQDRVEQLYITRYRRKTGDEFPGETFGSELLDGKNEAIGAFMIIRDITEREQAELRIQQTQRVESIGNLAGGIAHDFNNLLYPIIGMAEMLLEDLPRGSHERDNAGEIFRAGKRGAELVRQILAFSRQSGHKMVPTDIYPVLQEAVNLSRSTMPSYIQIRDDLSLDCGFVMADPTQLHQVALNLLTNAYHAMQAQGGRIDVTLDALDAADLPSKDLHSGRYARLSVSDTGHGISERHMSRIFDPYFTTKDQGKGTGLGLAVVYGIVKQHSGDIKVRSRSGKGTIVDVFLPLIDTPDVPPVTSAPEAQKEGCGRILVVDDEPPIIKLEKMMLERMGYEVVCRDNSLAALATFKETPDSFDLVLTDMTMPDMTGDMLAREIKQVRRDVPVVICTGFSERINKEKARDIGINGFLLKPVVKTELAAAVREAIEGQRAT